MCKRDVQINFEVVEEVEPTDWYVCMCRSMFHEVKRDKKYFGKMYLKRWKSRSDMKERFEYQQRMYIPLIEELTFGRKFLDVGFTLPYAIDFLKERGWITLGIDLVPNDYIKGDFETVNIPETFDYINMGHCLESFDNPIRAINKAYSMLNQNGVLMITHPNPEMIFEIGLQSFGHWESKQSHVFISKDKLEDIALRAGFQIVTSYRNISQRFVMHNDLHLLLQKKESC